MKHHDLVPQARLTLRRSGGFQVAAIFRFRTTCRACFEIEASGEWLELGALDDGGLADSSISKGNSRCSGGLAIFPIGSRWTILSIEPAPLAKGAVA